ncbi:phosphoribosyltransferase family protein [Neobacillus niacini]|uniref:phosphoribosyltransferase family protein n=1 Tax=Neobacillus niacini TaxID=86668 RepID=UPI002FFE4FD4
MKDTQILTLSKKTYTYTILDAITIDIEVATNSYQLHLEELFTMAARINKKRSFLFVSKVLGKHLPIDPQKGLLVAALLAARYAESIKGLECPEREKLVELFEQNKAKFESRAFINEKVNPVIIGFAETATALGHAFFDCFENAEYFHTTREELAGKTPLIAFEEEHSHATSHRCYIPLELLNNNREIILVDDEMTTGKTAINIIQSIHAQFPRNEYTVVSILDWRSDANKQQFKQLEKTLGIKINSVSLIAGNVEVNEINKLQEQENCKDSFSNHETTIEFLSLSTFFESAAVTTKNNMPLMKATGRFGIDSRANSNLHQKINNASEVLSQHRTGEKTLCLGTGEFMYIPMKLAAGMGENVFYQSTTRSPIYIKDVQDYGAKHGFQFPNPEDQSVSHFVYNIAPGKYDELFFFLEREVAREDLKPLLDQVEKLQVKSIKIVFFVHEKG